MLCKNCVNLITPMIPPSKYSVTAFQYSTYFNEFKVNANYILLSCLSVLIKLHQLKKCVTL